MAHYAKIGLNNEVIDMAAVDNINCMTPGGLEREEIGCEFLKNLTGHQVWIKCSYNTYAGAHYGEDGQPSGKPGFRANYPGIGWYYNSEHDIFHPARPNDLHGNPCNSWILNTVTGQWECPLGDSPCISGENSDYLWDEFLYQSDNTKGWIKQN